jgi:hypothetical protein
VAKTAEATAPAGKSSAVARARRLRRWRKNHKGDIFGGKNQKGDIAKNRRQKGDINTEQQHNGPRSSTPTLQSSMVAISHHVGHLNRNVS